MLEADEEHGVGRYRRACRVQTWEDTHHQGTLAKCFMGASSCPLMMLCACFMAFMPTLLRGTGTEEESGSQGHQGECVGARHIRPRRRLPGGRDDGVVTAIVAG